MDTPKVRITGKHTAAERRKIVAAVLAHRLDRRRAYAVGVFGELATVGWFTIGCAGCSCDCSEGVCSHGCAGCDECGYTGKSRDCWPEPVRIGSGYLQINPAKCQTCGRRMKHFDSGCKPCHAAFMERQRAAKVRDEQERAARQQ